jgi:hypothetical protein
MFQRFVPFRRMFAMALVGVALGACSGATEDATAPSNESPDLISAEARAFALTSHSVSFSYDEGTFTPASQTVEASGLITLAMGYVLIGKVQYEPSNIKDWLTVRMRPRGKIIEITLTPRFVPGVDLGGVSAVVPISVPGASNNPQLINVSLGEVFGCPILGTLAYPSQNPLVGNLQPGTTCQSEVLGTGERVFDPWAVTVPAGATFTVLMRSESSDAGTLHDAYLFLVDPVLNAVVRQDDDCGDGLHSPYYDSRIVWTNTDATSKQFYLLASQYSLSQFGTYTIDIYNGVFYPSYSPEACDGYSPGEDSIMLTPGAPLATDPMLAAVQRKARAKELQYRQRQ